MNRIEKLFQEKKNNILSVFFTAGYPGLNDTLEIIETLEKSGVDCIEVGMPFSDPVADGEIIQRSSEEALKNGMSVKLLFEQLKSLREKVKIPIILMGYLNPVFKYGITEFAAKCQEVGIDGLILPDLPANLYQKEFRDIFDKHNLINIFLITPQTPDSRIRYIDEISRGFIYMVSTASTTGTKSAGEKEKKEYFERVSSMNLKNPRLIGFGVKDKESLDFTCQHAAGAIIGSAFVKLLGEKGYKKEDVAEFINSLR